MEVTYEALKPVNEYPFPWSANEFCDTQPESVLGIPCDLYPLSISSKEDYDLIILGYTIWFLGPSIPMNSFLQSPEAKILLKDKSVMTVIACRNMWIFSQERIKKSISNNGGCLIGNIVLKDRAPNLLGVWSMAAWMLSGKKNRFWGILPKPGISDSDIKGASRFGKYILERLLLTGEFDIDQDNLNKQGAVEIKYTLLVMEKRVSRVFKIWAEFIRKKGGPGDANRKARVKGFFYYLIFVILFILPFVTLFGYVLRILNYKSASKQIRYYSSNHLE